MLLLDGVRYELHRFSDEKELENTVEEHFEDIFGEESIYFAKKKISSLSGIGSIPDGYAITLWGTPRWYVIETELSNHSIFDHIVPQINKFINGIRSDKTKRELVDYMEKEIRTRPLVEQRIRNRFREVYRFLSKLIDSPPTILIVIDEKTKELNDIQDSFPLKPQVLEFKTYAREGVGIAVHAHRFEPIYQSAGKALTKPIISSVSKGEITSQKEYTLPILEALIEMGGKGGVSDVKSKVYEKVKDRLKPKDLVKLPSGGAVRWRN